ncbi:MAG: hypothetical protein B7Z06_10210 [Flavobacteriales bacterium 32-35-8]|nr:MAG: hypothetical protein B7Z06_10210 [Flavobacteriales bacterium 32-35-8]
MSKQYEVKELTKKALRDALNNNTFWNIPLAPMPKSKAMWLVSNPRIADNDYCGVMGYENDKMVSFIYMLPDHLNINNDIQKVYWMIHWWVDDTIKNTVLGPYVYNEAVNLANKQVIIKAYAETAADFYKKQPYQVIASRLRHTLFFSLDSSILKGRFPFLKYFNTLVNIVDTFSYSVLGFINKPKLKNRTSHLKYEYINALDEDTWNFIEPLCKNDLILKTKAYINWQLSSLQYTQTPTSKHIYASLETGNSNNIYIHSLKVIKDSTIIGFLAFTINYNECNIKYFLTKEGLDYEACVDVLIEHVYATKSKFIFTDDTKLSDTITKRYKTIYTHKTTKIGLAHKSMGLDLTKLNLNLHDRDGHFY